MDPSLNTQKPYACMFVPANLLKKYENAHTCTHTHTHTHTHAAYTKLLLVFNIIIIASLANCYIYLHG